MARLKRWAVNHYHNRKGIEAPYTKKAVFRVRPESGGRSSLPWGTLMYAGEPKAH